MIHSNDDISWYDSLEDVKPEYFPIKAMSIFSFFRLKGRTSIISMENIEPLIPINYLLFSPKEDRYYLKAYRGYGLKEIQDRLYDGTDHFINSLDSWIRNGDIYLLFDKQGVADMISMLERIWNAHFTNKGKLPYTSFIEIIEATIKYEEYKADGREWIGYKTVLNTMENNIKELWDISYKSKR
jgi:hypothetical protein